jgi:hypothetical protein
MAGSYNHIITDQGNLVSNETFVKMIENLGDAYEDVEEMYGMIWWLAKPATGDVSSPEVLVEQARQNYEEGLKLAKANKNKKCRQMEVSPNALRKETVADDEASQRGPRELPVG